MFYAVVYKQCENCLKLYISVLKYNHDIKTTCLILCRSHMLWCIEAWTPQDLWKHPVVSGTSTLAADRKVRPPWVRFVDPANPIDGEYWDLGTLEAKHLASVFFKPFLNYFIIIFSLCIILQKVNTTERVVCGLQQFLGRLCVKVTSTSQENIAMSITLPLPACFLPIVHHFFEKIWFIRALCMYLTFYLFF